MLFLNLLEQIQSSVPFELYKPQRMDAAGWGFMAILP